MIEIIQPQTSEQWEQYYQLRYNILRKPWNQPPGSEKDDMEEKCIHLFALYNKVPAGVCRVQFNAANEAQIRFMGVEASFRGQNVGRHLMQHAEQIVKNHNCPTIVLQARENAVKFYQSCGFIIVEKTFLLWGQIQHFKMEKTNLLITHSLA